LVRQEFVRAREYAAKIKEAGDDPEKLPPRDCTWNRLSKSSRNNESSIIIRIGTTIS
jgi:hypothetical protein